MKIGNNIKIYELMALASKDPEKYEGKRYNVINNNTTCINEYGGCEYEAVFSENTFWGEYGDEVFFSINAEVQEV